MLVVFEGRADLFEPLTLTRPAFDLLFGCHTILDELFIRMHITDCVLLVRKYLEKLTQKNYPKYKVNPESISGSEEYYFANSFISPTFNLSKFAVKKSNFIVVSNQQILLAKLCAKHAKIMFDGLRSGNVKLKLFKGIKRYNLDGALLTYPWQIIESNPNALYKQLGEYKTKKAVAKDVKVYGSKRVIIQAGAQVESGVILDARSGGILIRRGAIINAPSKLIGPVSIGVNTIVKPFTVISHSSIGNNCRVAGEIEDSVICDYSNKAHEGYIGHSYVGEWVNLGAGTTTSNLKMTYGTIKMNVNGKRLDSNMNKLGVIMADMCKTAVGTYLQSGGKFGVASHLYGYVTSDIPSFTICAESFNHRPVELRLESAVETQRRMMERRGVTMGKEYEQMIKAVFKMTANDRRNARIAKGRFKI